MRKKTEQFIALIITALLAANLAGCLGDTEYKFESTGSSTVSATTSSSYVRTEYDPVRYPYFAMLDEDEKDAYSVICEELTEGNRKFDCKAEINAEQLAIVVDAVLNDHPELFWIDNNYGYSYEPVTGHIKELTFTFFDFADTPEKLAAAKAEFNSAMLMVVTTALDKGTMVERELFIHDYICENTTYDVDSPYNQSAYSALVLHRSVCAGYTRAFQLLMQKVGITCYYVPGRADGLGEEASVESGGDISHSWNIIILDGSYYNVDCLWDDTASEIYGEPIYPFFNVTDTELVHHSRIDMAVSLPKCTATEYRYSNQFGPTIEADSIIFPEED